MSNHRGDTAGDQDIRESKLYRGRYKVKATGAEGPERVKLYVSGSKGAAERVSRDD